MQMTAINTQKISASGRSMKFHCLAVRWLRCNR